MEDIIVATCEWCGKEFDIDDAREIFDDECGIMWSYDNFTKCLCGECAIEAIQQAEPGVYFDTCEECGKHFDYGEEYNEFMNYGGNDIDLPYCWMEKTLCASCAIEDIERENAMYGNHDDDEEDDD